MYVIKAKSCELYVAEFNCNQDGYDIKRESIEYAMTDNEENQEKVCELLNYFFDNEYEVCEKEEKTK